MSPTKSPGKVPAPAISHPPSPCHLVQHPPAAQREPRFGFWEAFLCPVAAMANNKAMQEHVQVPPVDPSVVFCYFHTLFFLFSSVKTGHAFKERNNPVDAWPPASWEPLGTDSAPPRASMQASSAIHPAESRHSKQKQILGL